MALYVAGAGHAFPETSLRSDELEAIGVPLSNDTKDIRARRSTINLEYLRSSELNKDPWDARKATTEHASHLGEAAARMALERAGLTVDDIGLIIADCNTPIETTPGEAQRIGGRLGIKVPAYDMTTGTAGLAQMINSISQWRKEKIPAYILLVANGVPTQSVNYGAPSGAHGFGDAAAALVISPTSGAFEVVESVVQKSESASSARFPTNGHIEFDVQAHNQLVKEAIHYLSDTDQVFGTFAAWLGSKDTVVSIHEEYGDCLGAAPVAAFSQHWDSAGAEKPARLVFAGAGARIGFVTLARSAK